METKLVLRKLLMLASLAAAAIGTAGAIPAQDSNSAPLSPAQVGVVPPLVRYSGAAANRAGDSVEAVFRIYSAQQGGEPVWSETQRIAIGADGKYSILLGAGTDGGIPAQVFAAGDARWLGVSIERAPEQQRTPLVSVAYAMKAADADSVGGMAANDLVTQAQLAQTARQMAAQAAQTAGPAPQLAPTGAGTTGYVPLWSSPSTLGDSILFQAGTQAAPLLGVNTSKPLATFDVAGASNFRGTLLVNAAASATSAAAVNSPILALEAKSYSSASNESIPQAFGWQTVATNNDAANPSANLNLLYGANTSAPAPTGLQIAPTGLITFAPGQIFPGTAVGNIASVTPGAGLTGGGSSGNVQIGLNTALVPLVNNQNTFTALQQFQAGVAITGGETLSGPLTAIGAALFADNVAGPTMTVLGTSASTGPVLLAQMGETGVEGLGTAYGVIGNAGGPNGTGVNGIGTQWGMVGVSSESCCGGVYGTSNNANGTGVYGLAAKIGVQATGTGSASYGLNAESPHVAVNALATSYSGIGIHAVVGAPAKIDAKLVSLLGPLDGAALWAESDGSQKGWGSPVLATGDDLSSIQAANNSSYAATFWAYNDGGGNTYDVVPVIHAAGRSGDCMLNSHGDSICTGAHAAAVPVDGGARQVEMYAVHAAENWFEDFGNAKLDHGVAIVNIDPDFARTISGQMDYEVFLTPRGDCEGLYVANQTATGFEVHELRKGTASVAFNYRITARRAGHESERMADVTGQMKSELARKLQAGATQKNDDER